MTRQIILRDLQQPKQVNLDTDIEWLSDSFGSIAGRDTERMVNQILHCVLERVAAQGGVSTENIAGDLHIATQRVNYHIRSLINSGFLYRERKLIFLRQGSVKGAVEEMRRDANRIFDNLTKIAEEIDAALGLKNRG